MLGGPWNVIAGSADSIAAADTMVFEDSLREKYGGLNLHSEREVNGHRVHVGGFTWGLQPFGPAYAFAEIELARKLGKVAADQTSFVLVRIAPGASAQQVASSLRRQVAGAIVLTAAEYRASIQSTLLREQLGISFGTSTSFGLLIGFVIVALSMFSSVIDNQRELGTLKALGWSQRLVVRQVTGESLIQSVLGGLLGIVVGLGGAALITAFAPTLKATVAQAATRGPGFFGPFGQGAVSAGSTSVSLTAPVSLGLVGLAVGLALLGGLISGAVGGFRAARLRPADALRHID
jgi:ABC-type antimicrobial peptide transport system permease subunit